MKLPSQTFSANDGTNPLPRPKKGSGRDERRVRNPAPEPAKPKPKREGVSPRMRSMVMERDKYCCVLCGSVGTKENPLHIGHVIPVAQGGTSGEENLRVECKDCNLGGGARHRPTPKLDVKSENDKMLVKLSALMGKKNRKRQEQA